MPSFEQVHFFLLELAQVFQPQSSHHFDHTYSSINQIVDLSSWDELLDGPTPTGEIDCTPLNWYIQYWFNCAQKHICADLDGYEFREICDYAFYDDETLYTGHIIVLY